MAGDGQVSYVVAPPLLDFEISNGATGHGACGVDHDIDFSEGRDGFLEEALDVGLGGDFGGDGEHFGVLGDGSNGLGGLFQEGFLAADEDDSFGSGLSPSTGSLLRGLSMPARTLWIVLCEEHTPPIPPVAPVIRTVLPEALSSGFFGSMAG